MNRFIPCRTRLSGRASTLVAAGAGIAAGTAAGVVAVAIAAGLALGGSTGAGNLDGLLEVAHVPPLLTVPGEDVTLRYAIVCPPPGGDIASGAPCDGSGDVYIRAGQSGPFTKLALERGSDSIEGRWFVRVPAQIATSPTASPTTPYSGTTRPAPRRPFRQVARLRPSGAFR